MRPVLATSLLAALLASLLLPAVAAAPNAGNDATGPAPDATRGPTCGAPCGYIRPTMTLDFPDLPACSKEGQTCRQAPAPGETLTIQGTVTWGWDAARDGVYPIDANSPPVITFSPSERNPSWLKVKVEPESLPIDVAALADPNRFEPGADPSAPTLWYRYTAPITMTIERAGAVDVLKAKYDVVLRAESNPSGAYFTAGFVVKPMKLAPPTDMSDEARGTTHSSPGAALGALATVMAAAVVLQRRRA